MPAKQRHPAPHQQLLDLARQARTLGLSFEDFWGAAMPAPKAECPRCGGPVKRFSACSRIRRSRRCGGVPGPLAPYARDENGMLIPESRLPSVQDAEDGQVGWVRGAGSDHGRAAYTAIQESRVGWERAYSGTPASRSERALVILGPVFEGGELAGAAVA